jgi:hypothetical protein
MRMYERQSLDIQPLPEGGTEVRIVLPAHETQYSTEASKMTAEVSDRMPAHHG